MYRLRGGNEVEDGSDKPVLQALSGCYLFNSYQRTENVLILTNEDMIRDKLSGPSFYYAFTLALPSDLQQTISSW